MEKERFEKQLRFILEIDKEKNILRQTHLSLHGRRENDAEHAWHMAIMVYLFKEYANRDFNLEKAMMMALIHDIAEIYAGDTYAYDEKAKLTQTDRENEGADRIFSLLPQEQSKDLRALFDEFNEGKTPEAQFVKAMDNFQPLLLNNSNGGSDWREHKVAKHSVMARHGLTKFGSEDIFEYCKAIIEENVKKGNIKDE